MKLLDSVHGSAIRTAFALWYGWRPYGRYATVLEETQWWSWSDIQAFQMRKLSALVNHAYTHVPFYRRRFQEAGARPEDIQTSADLACLPLLTKRDIQVHLDELLAANIDRQLLRENHTGGSTGHPMTFYHDARFRAWGEADLLRNYRMTGYRLGMRWAFLWGSDYDARAHKGWIGRLKDRVIYNTLWINTFDLTTETLLQAAEKLVRWQPRVLVAYVSSATMLARLVRSRDIEGIHLSAIQTSAEVLTQDARELLEETFRCPVFDRYGCREVGNIAHECDVHQGLHILGENNLVELLDSSGHHVEPNQPGRIIVTNLNNYAMPFIRYEVGDMGVASQQTCTCGRNLPLMNSIVGRTSDVITSPSGKLLHGEFFTHLFYKLDGIHQFRVVQETRSNLHVQIVPEPGFDQEKALKFLEDTILRQGDPAFVVRFELCDRLPPAPSGKYRFTISHVPLTLKQEGQI